MKKRMGILLLCGLLCLPGCGKSKTVESVPADAGEEQAETLAGEWDVWMETPQADAEGKTGSKEHSESEHAETEQLETEQEETNPDALQAEQTSASEQEQETGETENNQVKPEPIYPEETNPLVPDGIQLPLVPVQ